MLKREKAPLREELPVFTEFAALRACVSKTGPWHDGLRAPALGRPEAGRPPARPPKWLSSSGYARAQDELLWNTCLGTADARLWVTFPQDTFAEEAVEAAANTDAQGTATAVAEGAKENLDLERRLTLAQSFSQVPNVKAFLCHKSLLRSSGSLVLKNMLQEAEVRNHELHKEYALAKSSAKRSSQICRDVKKTLKKGVVIRGDMKKLDPLVEIEITLQECPEAFEVVMDWLYGKPLQLTSADLREAADMRWWPLLGLAQDLQLLELEDMLRTPLLEMSGASANYMWSLLHLCTAHRLEAEMARCSDFLARLGGRGNMSEENNFQDLPLEGLTALLSSEAWVVSEEIEIYFILIHWMQGQPWYANCTKRRNEDNAETEKEEMEAEDEEEPWKVPQEVAEAAGRWGIRWAFLPKEYVQTLAEIGLVPLQLVGDCDRWRFTARRAAPELPKGDEWGHLDKLVMSSGGGDWRKADDAHKEPKAQQPQKQRSRQSLSAGSRRSSNASSKSSNTESGAGTNDQEGGAAGAEGSDGKKSKSHHSKDFDVGNDGEKARAKYGIPASLSSNHARALQMVLEMSIFPGYPVPLSPGHTIWRNGAVLAQQSQAQAVANEFLSGTKKLCDRVDGRFLPESRKSQIEADLNRILNVRGDPNEEALTKARKVAMKHLEFVNPYCPWMNRRRCIVRNFKLPDDCQEFFPVVFEEQDVLVMICRKHNPKAGAGGQQLNLAQLKETDEDIEDQEEEAMNKRGSMPASHKFSVQAASFSVQAPKAQQPAFRSPRAVNAGTGAVKDIPAKVEQPEQPEQPHVRDAKAILTRHRTFDAGPARRGALKAPLTDSSSTRLVGTLPLKGGRHEVLFRILVRRRRKGSGAHSLVAAHSVARSLTNAVRLGMAVYSGGGAPAAQSADGSGASSAPRRQSMPTREMGTAVTTNDSLPVARSESEIITERVEQAALCKALADSMGQSLLGAGGLVDVTILMVLDLSVDPPKLSYAVEAAITNQYSPDIPDEESEEDKPAPAAAPTDKQEASKDGPSEEGAAATGTVENANASPSLGGPITSEPDVKQEGAGEKKAFRLKKAKRASTRFKKKFGTTLPEPTNFLQDRRFLKVWHSEEMLVKELQTGFQVSKEALAVAGPRVRFAPVIEVTPHLLSSIGGAGSQARLEILPHGALRSEWWSRRMGGTADMPRSATGAEAVKGWQM